MTTTQSSSQDKARKPAEEQAATKKKDSSVGRLFSYSLIVFFVLQVVIGTVLIVLFIGKEMTLMQEANVKSELSSRSQRLVSFLQDRLLILDDYSRLPNLIAGVMQPGEHLANTVDLLESLPFLTNDVNFMLQDFQGNRIYSKLESVTGESADTFQGLMGGRLKHGVEIIAMEGSSGKKFWRLSVPVKYHDLPEGILSAYLPVRMKEIFPETGGNVRIDLQADGTVASTMGEVPEPTITFESNTGFPGIVLRQAVSKQFVNQRIEFLIIVMLVSLVLGTGAVMLVVNRLGHKFLLVPHKQLQAMSDELEKDVEKRTADLKMRTVQLSIEIRERREAEIEARETGNLVSALLEGIGAAFFIVNPTNGTIVRSNKVMQEMFGLAPWQLSNRSCAELFSGLSEAMSELACPVTVGSDRYLEGIAQHADGTIFPVSRYLVPMEIQGEQHIGVIMLDITERKSLERQLNVAQKLESVGELASGIAHEINTPIQYVGDSIRFVEEAVDDIIEILNAEAELVEKCKAEGLHAELTDRIAELEDDADLEFVIEEIPKACSRALDGTERVANIVKAMKNFAHPGTGEMSSIDINQALENTIVVSKNEWKYVADIIKDFDIIPMVKCLPGDINQVLLNILVNAAHAIGDVVGNSGDKGAITISTRASKDHVTVMVADTGTGMTEEVRNKIFDPFFTTKEVGKGTGQGLAIVHDIIVERHGGSIDIESEIGKGSTFIINLPLTGK